MTGKTLFEPSHEILALFVLRKLILQTRTCRHPVGLDVWFLVGPFVYFHTPFVRTAKALARLRRWAGLPEPSLVAYVISTVISWAGLFIRMKIIMTLFQEDNIFGTNASQQMVLDYKDRNVIDNRTCINYLRSVQSKWGIRTSSLLLAGYPTLLTS